MKTKIIILFLLFGCFNFALPTIIHASNDTDLPLSAEVPSESYLRKEKRSIAGSDVSALAASERGISSRVGPSNWDDGLIFPGTGGQWEEGNAGNVGGPIGDATIPVVLSILLLYVGYRKVTISKRKNNL